MVQQQFGRRVGGGWAAALVLAAAVAGAGCKMTPEEIRVIRTENELLREQVQTLRERCVQERELELRPGDPDDRRTAPAPPP
jgi:hypothetical protein